MSNRLLYTVKNSRIVYLAYFYIGSFVLKFLRFFIRPSKKNILFIAFGGKKFGDSPKAIYEGIIKDKRFKDCNIYWGLNNPKSINLPYGKSIKTDTLQYFITALKCGIWITNSSATRGLEFKPKSTFCLNTWHGTPIKKIGYDTNAGSVMFKSKANEESDVILVQSDYDLNCMRTAFRLPVAVFAKMGYPRNDALFSYNDDDVRSIKGELNIPLDKKVILYAPTFREYELDHKQCYFKAPFNIANLKGKLGDKYVFLFRAHYEVCKLMGIESDDFLINVSDYSNINDLMIISDVHVSDYSSTLFDYSILHRPMICYTYDYDIYNEKRGIYFDIRKELTSCNNEDELISTLLNLDYRVEVSKCELFQKKFVTEIGDSTQKCLDLLFKQHI